MAPENWIAVDCDTRTLRLWRMAGERVVEAVTSDSGGGTPESVETQLLSLLGEGDASAMPVLVCGMAGAPYLSVPCKPPSVAHALRRQDDGRLDMRLLPGLSQARPADLMCGEETRIAGFMAAEPRFDGVLCLPGAQSKWVHVSAGEVVSFRTFMTGELLALLGSHTLLRDAIGTGWDQEAFDTAVSDAMGRPAGLAADLFTLHAARLLQDAAPDAARARLSGLLIGMELAAARPYWLGQDVVILGENDQAQAYLSALTAQSAMCRTTPATDAALRGLIAAWTDPA